MKIIHVGLDVVPSSGGSYQAIRDFSHVTDSMVISFTGTGNQVANQKDAPPVLHIPTAPGFLGRAFSWASERDRARAAEVVKDADLVVCHILWRYHVHWIETLAERYDIPYWVVPHGCLDPYVFSYRSFIKKVWFYLFGRSFLREAAGVIFATEREKTKASTYYDGENCRVVRWPVCPIDTSRREFARHAIRQRHAINPDDKMLIFLGRLHQSKRPLETIAAFAESGVANTHLVLVGPEETLTQKDCAVLVERLGARNVHIVGPVYGEDRDDYLLAADSYISLSDKENFGYAAAEALSAGLPVILSPGNDLTDELLPLECGWFLNDNKPETAARAIREFSETGNHHLRNMGERGRRWVVENLSYENFTEKITQMAHHAVSIKKKILPMESDLGW